MEVYDQCFDAETDKEEKEMNEREDSQAEEEEIVFALERQCQKVKNGFDSLWMSKIPLLLVVATKLTKPNLERFTDWVGSAAQFHLTLTHSLSSYIVPASIPKATSSHHYQTESGHYYLEPWAGFSFTYGGAEGQELNLHSIVAIRKILLYVDKSKAHVFNLQWQNEGKCLRGVVLCSPQPLTLTCILPFVVTGETQSAMRVLIRKAFGCASPLVNVMCLPIQACEEETDAAYFEIDTRNARYTSAAACFIIWQLLVHRMDFLSILDKKICVREEVECFCSTAASPLPPSPLPLATTTLCDGLERAMFYRATQQGKQQNKWHFQDVATVPELSNDDECFMVLRFYTTRSIAFIHITRSAKIGDVFKCLPNNNSKKNEFCIPCGIPAYWLDSLPCRQLRTYHFNGEEALYGRRAPFLLFDTQVPIKNRYDTLRQISQYVYSPIRTTLQPFGVVLKHDKETTPSTCLHVADLEKLDFLAEDALSAPAFPVAICWTDASGIIATRQPALPEENEEGFATEMWKLAHNASCKNETTDRIGGGASTGFQRNLKEALKVFALGIIKHQGFDTSAAGYTYCPSHITLIWAGTKEEIEQHQNKTK